LKLKLEKKWFAAVGAGIIIVFCIVLFNLSLSLKGDLGNLKAQQNELYLLKEECLSLKGRIEAVEGKRSLSKVEGIVQAFDEVFRSLGLKQKLKYVKPLGTKKLEGAKEEEAEVEVERVNMNEAINILYKVENAPMVLSVRKATFQTSFEDPGLLNITMTIALVVAE
jgi:hypothetical protein